MKYFWIGHCKEDSHDKIWGMIMLPVSVPRGYNDYLTFWGRRGKKLQTKMYRSITVTEANRLCYKKEDRGYRTIERLDSVYPEFEQDLEQTAVWALLKG